MNMKKWVLQFVWRKRSAAEEKVARVAERWRELESSARAATSGAGIGMEAKPWPKPEAAES